MMAHSGGCLTLASMAQQESMRRLEVTFVGAPQARQVALASGVSDVEVNDHRLRCVVEGSVQPFLEALHGSEVITLTSVTCGGGG